MKITGCITLLLLALSACGDSLDLDALREAVANSKVKMADMAAVAEASMPNGRTISAKLRVGETPVYAYGTIGQGTLHDVRIDTVEGRIVSHIAAGARAASGSGPISIAEAITIAEAQITSGSAIAAIPDDDVACAREIQVLTPDTLWEVKVSGTGVVLERELSDEGED